MLCYSKSVEDERGGQVSMADTPGQEIKLFYCYAREDKALRDELEIHLSALKRQYRLTSWHDREILPGEDWEKAIDAYLSTAHIILLLISPHFMASEYCYGKEMGRALERHRARACRVIPILLRPTYWEGAPFSGLQMLPTDARPVTSWPDRYEAFHDVVQEISRVIKDLLISPKTTEDWLKEGIALYELKRYEEALAAYEKAIRLDPNFAAAYNNKGDALYKLNCIEEALAAYEQAVRLDPNFAEPYSSKGALLCELKRYREALASCEEAIRLDPKNAQAYYNKGVVLNGLQRYMEALSACEQAIRLDPNSSANYNNKSVVLNGLQHYKEALLAAEQSIRLDPKNAAAYNNKGAALNGLKRREDALLAFEQAIRLDPNFVQASTNKDVTFINLLRK
jgi:tetratricopeptide (TPR) repeat protein